jgi:CRP-like cAMP-binding protein
MVSPELLRRFGFFAVFSEDYLKALARNARELAFDEDHRFFLGGEEINNFFLVAEGQIGIIHSAPAPDVEHGVANQLVGTIETEDVVVSTVDRGEVFGWSSLLPPYRSTAGAVSLTSGNVVVFDSVTLRSRMRHDTAFGFKLTQRLAQVIHGRLRDRQIECVSGAGKD